MAAKEDTRRRGYIPFLRKRESTLVMSHRAEGIDVGRVTKDMTRDKNTKKNIIRQWLNIAKEPVKMRKRYVRT